jgi:signal transduction histidine kinase/ligand-binding sensor domain-containing protein
VFRKTARSFDRSPASQSALPDARCRRRPGPLACSVARACARLALPLCLTVAFLLACSRAGTPASPATRAPQDVASLSTTSRSDRPSAEAQRSLPSQIGHVRFDRYSVEDGLSQSVGQRMLQDRQGFLWVATEDGLNRFDGYTFKVFRNDPEDPHSLSNSTLLALHEDRLGGIWVGTFGGGLNRYDPETEQFTRYRHDPEDSNSLSSDYVRSIYRDRTGALWVGTVSNGLDRYDAATGRWTHYRHDPDDPYSLGGNAVPVLLEDSSGELWIGTNRGLDRLDPESVIGGDGPRFVHYQHDPGNPYSLSANLVLTLFEDPSNTLWVGTIGGGLNRFDRDTETFARYLHDPGNPYSLSDDTVRAVLVDSVGTLWVGTVGGLDRLENAAAIAADEAHFVHYRHDPADPHSLGADAVQSLLEDRSGGVWVGTYGGGLGRYDRRGQQFTYYRLDPNDENSLSAAAIWAIQEDRSGMLWIGTHGGGLDRYDRRTGEWRHYRNDPDDPGSLASDTILSILEDREGILWFGTDAGLDRLDPRNGSGPNLRFDHFQSDAGDPHSLSNNSVWTILQDRQGIIWLGTDFGLNSFDPQLPAGSETTTLRFTRYLYDPDDANSLSNSRVWPIYEDRFGVLWIGTNGGLNSLDPDRKTFTRYLNDPDDPQSLSNNAIFCIHEDRSGVLWIGTWGGGLNRLDRRAGSAARGAFAHYRVKDGLPNDSVYGILEEGGPPDGQAGRLWLSTNNGLSRFDPQTETFRNYGVRDGLQSVEFNLGAHHQSSSGEMFFGGIMGLNAFYPDRITDNPYVPPVVPTSFTQDGEPLTFDQAGGKPASAIQSLTLKWPDNDFEFEFAALSYFQPDNNRYSYMLEGYDDDWNHIGTRRYGGYTNLPGGSYTLRLRGSNNDGWWNEQGRSIQITIVPPFWATWWFRGTVALLAVSGVLGGLQFRIRTVEAQRRELEAQVRVRTGELAARTEELAARTRELQALNAVASVVSHSLDLDQVLADALEKTLQVMETEAGGIYILDDRRGALDIAAHRGFSPGFVAAIDGLAVGEGLSGLVAQTGRALVVPDVSADVRLTRMAVRDEGLHSLAIAPLHSQGKVLGTLFAVTRGYREFGERDVRLLTSIAQQIGVALDNARLFAAEQHRSEQFRVIAEVGRRMTLTPNVDEVLEQIVRLIQRAFGYYHVGIGLVEGDEVIYRVGAGELWDDPQFDFEPARLRVGVEGLTGWVAASGQPVVVPDVAAEPRYVWMHGSKTRSELLVPITAKGEVIGVLDVQSDHLDAFDDTDLAVLQSLAHQAGAAVENAQLYAQSRQVAVAEERNRLARELHDAVTQTLFSASLIAEAVPDSWENDPEEGRQLLEELRQLSRGALAEMRTLLLELRPAALVETDLCSLLRQLAEAATGREGIPVTVKAEGRCRLPTDVHVGLYRIAQEALNNVVKHSYARQVQVSLISPSLGEGIYPGPGERVELVIQDDGRGFDPDDTPPDRLGMGIMRERAQAIGADLTIESELGRGTVVRVVWKAPG